MTVFINTHHLADAERLCDLVGVIREGRLIALGHPDEVRGNTGAQRVVIVGSGFDERAVGLISACTGVGSVTHDDRRMHVELSDEASVPEIVRAAVEAGIRIEEVRRGSESLEEAFLTLLRRRRRRELMIRAFSDMWLVATKELREVALRQGGSRASVFNLALIVLVFGVFMPLQAGVAWVQQPWMLFVWAWLPLFMVSALVADSFAGERERHTLETLLTTPLSDNAILFGKLLAAVVYGYGALLVVFVVSLVTVNLRYGTWRIPLMFSREVTLGVLVVGFLATLFVAAIGVMISLKAQTVRQAGLTLSLGILATLWIPGLALGYLYRTLSEPTRALVTDWFVQLDLWVIAVGAVALLALVDAAFIAVAMRRFRRSELTFD